VRFAVSASGPAASCSGLYPGQRPGLHLPGAAGHRAGEPGRRDRWPRSFPHAGTTGNPDQHHRWRRLLSCSSRHATAPPGSLGSSLGLATAGPHGSTWPGWRGGDQTGQVLASLDPARRGVPAM